MADENKKLLILDLDETLIFAEESPLNRQEDFRVGAYYVYKRPFLKEFVEFCLANFEVAIWTSSTRNYAMEIVNHVFPDSNILAFSWSRERCTIRYDQELQETYLEKMMSKVRRRGYDLRRAIVVDDSPEKWRNSYGNLVRVKPFFGETDDNELEKLVIYLERLNDAENIRKIEKRNWKNRI